MKMFRKLKENPHVIQEILLSIIIITLPISIQLNSYAIILLLVYLLFFSRISWIKNLNLVWRTHRIFLAIPILYIIQIAGLLHTSDFSDGFKSLETKLSLFVIPVLIAPMDLSKKTIILLLKIFVFSVLGSAMYCHAIMIQNILQNDLKIYELFTSYQYQTSYLTEPIGVNPIYFSLYVSFSLLVCLWLIQVGNFKYIFIFIYTYLQVFNILIVSRTSLAVQLLLCTGYVLIWLISTKSYIKIAVLIFVLVSLLITTITYIPNYSHRFLTLFSPQYTSPSSTSLHVNSWKCGLGANGGFKILFGQGSGDEIETLSACYISKGLHTMATDKLNCHSEYLSTYVRHGLIGVFTLIAIIYFFVYYGFRNNNIILILFTILFALVSTTESTLSVQKGVVFFSLFSSMLLSSSLKQLKFTESK
jgi:hypothetical protein